MQDDEWTRRLREAVASPSSSLEAGRTSPGPIVRTARAADLEATVRSLELRLAGLEGQLAELQARYAALADQIAGAVIERSQERDRSRSLPRWLDRR